MVAPGRGAAGVAGGSGTSRDQGTSHPAGASGGPARPIHTARAPSGADGQCTSIGPRAPAITVPDDPGVAYVVDGVPQPAGTYPATAGTHLVQATSDTYRLVGPTRFPLTLASIPPACNPNATPRTPIVTQSQCSANGTPTEPSLQLATTFGVTYTASSAPPYRPGQQVLVTATADAAHTFAAPLPTGWTLVDDAHATYLVSFVRVDCDRTVRPAAPTLVQASCTAGGVSAPSLTLPGTPGIVYAVDPTAPYRAGQTVIVSASATPGHRLVAPAGSEWTLIDRAHATYRVVFDELRGCSTPAAPTFREAECAIGAQPDYTIPTTGGVQYAVNGVGRSAGTYPAEPGSTVVVTARPLAGYQLVGATRFTHAFAARTCRTPVRAADPRFTSAACGDNGPIAATFTVPATPGVEYRVRDRATRAGTYPAAAGASITVTTVPKPGTELTGPTRWDHDFAVTTPSCLGVDSAATSRPSAGYGPTAGTTIVSGPTVTSTSGTPPTPAATGVAADQLALLTATLLLLGVAGCAAGRTRRRPDGGP